MGKSNTINTLGRVIGNTALHKFAAKYTERKESIPFLTAEINAYRDLAMKVFEDYFWSDYDKGEIKKKALSYFNDKKIKKYPELEIKENESEEFVLEVMKEIGLY